MVSLLAFMCFQHLHTLMQDAPATVADFTRLELNAIPLMEKNLEYLNESLDDIVMEQQKVSCKGGIKAIFSAQQRLS